MLLIGHTAQQSSRLAKVDGRVMISPAADGNVDLTVMKALGLVSPRLADQVALDQLLLHMVQNTRCMVQGNGLPSLACRIFQATSQVLCKVLRAEAATQQLHACPLAVGLMPVKHKVQNKSIDPHLAAAVQQSSKKLLGRMGHALARLAKSVTPGALDARKGAMYMMEAIADATAQRKGTNHIGICMDGVTNLHQWYPVIHVSRANAPACHSLTQSLA